MITKYNQISTSQKVWVDNIIEVLLATWGFKAPSWSSYSTNSIVIKSLTKYYDISKQVSNICADS